MRLPRAPDRPARRVRIDHASGPSRSAVETPQRSGRAAHPDWSVQARAWKLGPRDRIWKRDKDKRIRLTTMRPALGCGHRCDQHLVGDFDLA